VLLFTYLFIKINKVEKNPENQECFIIVNPNAGNGKGHKDWERISELLKKNQIPATVKSTEKKGHTIEFTREAIKNGFLASP
jgi:diacylglycerol kinase family enzyme